MGFIALAFCINFLRYVNSNIQFWMIVVVLLYQNCLSIITFQVLRNMKICGKRHVACSSKHVWWCLMLRYFGFWMSLVFLWGWDIEYFIFFHTILAGQSICSIVTFLLSISVVVYQTFIFADICMHTFTTIMIIFTLVRFIFHVCSFIIQCHSFLQFFVQQAVLLIMFGKCYWHVYLIFFLSFQVETICLWLLKIWEDI